MHPIGVPGPRTTISKQPRSSNTLTNTHTTSAPTMAPRPPTNTHVPRTPRTNNRRFTHPIHVNKGQLPSTPSFQKGSSTGTGAEEQVRRNKPPRRQHTHYKQIYPSGNESSHKHRQTSTKHTDHRRQETTQHTQRPPKETRSKAHHIPTGAFPASNAIRMAAQSSHNDERCRNMPE